MRHWFDKELFLGLMRVRGMEGRSPTWYADAFICRKLGAWHGLTAYFSPYARAGVSASSPASPSAGAGHATSARSTANCDCVYRSLAAIIAPRCEVLEENRLHDHLVEGAEYV
jgi:hypothetical protein